MNLIYKTRSDGSEGDVAAMRLWIAAGLVVLVLVVLSMWLMPIYNVWAAGMAGQAELSQAEQNRQIVITEAEAQNQAATSQAEARVKQAEAQARAEVARARGVAEANQIIGESLKGNEEYLRYLYITGITEKGGQIIYVPTEGGLPILEAGKRP